MEAYRTLVLYRNNIKRMLTSGGANSCVGGVESLRKLVEIQHEFNGPEILPG